MRCYVLFEKPLSTPQIKRQKSRRIVRSGQYISRSLAYLDRLRYGIHCLHSSSTVRISVCPDEQVSAVLGLRFEQDLHNHHKSHGRQYPDQRGLTFKRCCQIQSVSAQHNKVRTSFPEHCQSCFLRVSCLGVII